MPASVNRAGRQQQPKYGGLTSAVKRATSAACSADAARAWTGALAILSLCCLPALLTVARLVSAVRNGVFAFDFHNYYWPSGHDVLHGQSPFPPPIAHAAFLTRLYPAGPYPASVAVLFAPFALLPLWLAEAIFTASLVVALFMALRLLGVRDWRCYGAAFLWAPIGFAIQTANLTLLLALGLTLVWRFRHRTMASALVLGTLIALKLFLWPLIIWLLATRRYAAAAYSLVAAVVITLSTWAMLGFAGFRDYPHVGRIFADHYGPGTYTPLSVLVKLGVASPWARLGAVTLGVAVLTAVLAVARRSQTESTSFALATGAALLWTPIAWLHYFSLIIIPLAILSPTLSLAWLLPVLLWACPVGGPSSAWQFALPLVVSAAVLLLAVRDRLRRVQQLRASERGEPGGPPVVRRMATEVELAR